MIKFNNLSQEKPYLLFKQKYEEAFNANQKNIEAISIASFNKDDNEVDSRFVNIKFIDKDRFIGWPTEGIVEWVYGTPHGPGGHPLEQGHQIIANKILESLQ